MSSLFDLKQSASELPSLNQGMAKLTYEQYTPQRSVVGEGFKDGQIHIKFSMSGSRWWVPARSYVRIRARYGTTALAAVPIVEADDVAPNMGTCANLFQNCEFRMAGKTISRIEANLAQVDALENRLLKSKAWLDGVGASLNNWEASQNIRKQKISSDGSSFQNDDVAYGYVDRLAMGFANDTTIAFTLANATDEVIALVTFATGAIPDVRVVWANGDYLVYNGVTYKVIARPSNVTLSVIRPDGKRVVVNAAATDAFYKVPSELSHRGSVEFIWQPPLSIFKIGHALPAGDYELLLNPQPGSNFELLSVESTLVDKVVGNGGAQFHFHPVDLFLYVATVEGPAVSDLTYFMSLEETRCQRRNITGNASTLTQEPFEVSPSTYALTIAFQDQTAGSGTLRSQSKFKIRPSVDYPGDELRLNRMFLQYAGQSKSSPDADPSYTSPDDFLSSRYAESQLYSMNYYSEGSPESKADWLQRGPYYYFAWPRDGTSEATHVTANFSFQGGLAVASSGNVLLFDHHKKMILVSVQDGKIIDVIEQSG